MDTHKIFYRPDGGKGDAYVILVYFNNDGDEFTFPIMKYHWPSMIDVSFISKNDKPTPVLPCERDEEQQLLSQSYLDITNIRGSIPLKLHEWLTEKLRAHYEKLNERSSLRSVGSGTK